MLGRTGPNIREVHSTKRLCQRAGVATPVCPWPMAVDAGPPCQQALQGQGQRCAPPVHRAGLTPSTEGKGRRTHRSPAAGAPATWAAKLGACQLFAHALRLRSLHACFKCGFSAGTFVLKQQAEFLLPGGRECGKMWHGRGKEILQPDVTPAGFSSVRAVWAWNASGRRRRRCASWKVGKG